MTEQGTETFRPTNGRVMGVIGLAAVLGFLVIGLSERMPLWYFGLLACVGVLIWASILRPGVRIAGDRLVLRSMFTSVGVPLAAITQVAVGRVMVVRAGARRFVSPAINRPLRQLMRGSGAGRSGGLIGAAEALAPPPAISYPDYVETTISTSAANHRARLGIIDRSDEQEALARDVHRELALPELIAMAVAVLLLLVGLVLTL